MIRFKPGRDRTLSAIVSRKGVPKRSLTSAGIRTGLSAPPGLGFGVEISDGRESGYRSGSSAGCSIGLVGSSSGCVLGTWLPSILFGSNLQQCDSPALLSSGRLTTLASIVSKSLRNPGSRYFSRKDFAASKMSLPSELLSLISKLSSSRWKLE